MGEMASGRIDPRAALRRASAQSFSEAALIQKYQEKDKVEKLQKEILDYNLKLYDKSSAYMNVVLVAGYAGAFTVWNFTRSQLPATAVIWVAMLLTLSIACFVAFEVLKMFLGTKLYFNSDLYKADFPTFEEAERAYKKAKESDSKLTERLIPIWQFTVFFCVITAIAAIGLLLYNFVANLTGLPPWPR